MPKKAFVTGISGFTGSHMSELLLAKGFTVAGIAQSSRRLINIKHLKNKLSFFECKLSNEKKLKKIIENFSPNYVFHFASPIIRSQSMNINSLKINLQTDLFETMNLLDIISALKNKPVVLITGSNAEYQISNKNPITEDCLLYPQSSYGLSKLTQEFASFNFAKSHSLPLVYTRTFHLIGPRQTPDFVVSDFARQIAQIELGQRKPQLFIGNSLVKRDFTDVRDAVRAYWLAISKGKSYQIFNICSGKSVSIKKIIKLLQTYSKSKIKIIKQKIRFRNGDPLEIVGNNKKIRNLGWQPRYSIEESLKDTLNYWRNLLNTSR